MWQERRWRFLLSIISQLPAHSRYAEAVADDEELAEATLFDEPSPFTPRLSSWSPEVAEQRITNERLGIVAQLLGVIARNPYTPTPLPRSVVARERVRQRYEQRRHERLTRQLLPPEEVDGALPG